MQPIGSRSLGTGGGWAIPGISVGWPRSSARPMPGSCPALPSRSTARVRWGSCDAREGISVTANGMVRDLVDRCWEGLLEREPLMGTFIGDERYDDRLPDLGPAGRAAEETASRQALVALAAIDADTLEDADRADLDVMRAICERSLARIEQRIDRFEVVNHMHGAGTMLAQVASLQRADTPERVDRYEARLRAFPGMLDAAIEIAREAVATGVVVPKIVAERALAQLDRILALPPEDSPAMIPLGDGGAAKERIAATVREVLYPAHARFRDVVREEYLPASTQTIGMSALPDG